MFLMCDITDLWDHIAYMVLCCPDDFPIEDFLSAEDQMTMEKGFSQLHEGILIAYPEEKYTDQTYTDLRQRLSNYLVASKKAFEDGEEVKGAHLLQDFQNEIFTAKGKVRFLTV